MQVACGIGQRMFWRDLTILWLTVRKVLRSEGINQAGQAAMEEFKGTNNG